MTDHLFSHHPPTGPKALDHTHRLPHVHQLHHGLGPHRQPRPRPRSRLRPTVQLSLDRSAHLSLPRRLRLRTARICAVKRELRAGPVGVWVLDGGVWCAADEYRGWGLGGLLRGWSGEGTDVDGVVRGDGSGPGGRAAGLGICESGGLEVYVLVST
jgi:hypothetical protein